MGFHHGKPGMAADVSETREATSTLFMAVMVAEMEYVQCCCPKQVNPRGTGLAFIGVTGQTLSSPPNLPKQLPA